MRALITGVSGQDGSYLAELLAARGERVQGTVHPHEPLPPYIEALQQAGRLELHAVDLGDTSAWRRLLRELRPARVFHLAAVSAPREAAGDPARSRRVNVDSAAALAEWIGREAPDCRALLCSSAAIFGRGQGGAALSEASPVAPVDLYGEQKLAVRELARELRAARRFVACAVPFNHESERRSDAFVFAKVCRAAASIAAGQQAQLRLGSLSPRRDWGYAPEYVEALAAMLDAPEPLELVLATGEGRSVEELAEAAFAAVGLDWRAHVQPDFMLQRAADYDLVGDPSEARAQLGWAARTRFAALIERLVAAFRPSPA